MGSSASIAMPYQTGGSDTETFKPKSMTKALSKLSLTGDDHPLRKSPSGIMRSIEDGHLFVDQMLVSAAETMTSDEMHRQEFVDYVKR